MFFPFLLITWCSGWIVLFVYICNAAVHMTVIFAICVVVYLVTYNVCYNHCEAAETAKLWCPVCKRGDLRETRNLIYCTLCKLRLDLEEDKVVCICIYAGCLYKLFGKRQLGNLIASICSIRWRWSPYENGWPMHIQIILTEDANQHPSSVYRLCLAWLHSTYSVKNAAHLILWYNQQEAAIYQCFNKGKECYKTYLKLFHRVMLD